MQNKSKMASNIEVEVDAPAHNRDIWSEIAEQDDETSLRQQVEHLQNRLSRAEAQSDAYLRAQESLLELEAQRKNRLLQAQVMALESEVQRLRFQRMRDESDTIARDLVDVGVASPAAQDEITMLKAESDRLKSEVLTLEKRLRLSEEQLAEKDLHSASREEKLAAQLQQRDAETAALRMEAGNALSQVEKLAGERDALQRTCDSLSSETAQKAEIASQLDAMRSQLSSSEEHRYRLRDTCRALEESAIQQAQDLKNLVTKMEEEIAKGRVAQERWSEAQSQIEWLKEERERMRQQLDAARIEFERQQENDSYNAIELRKAFTRHTEGQSEMSKHEAEKEQIEEGKGESVQLRAMLERELHENKVLMKQREDMMLQLKASAAMIETLRSQLAEAAVSLARNEEERKARLRAKQQSGALATREAGCEADRNINEKVLPGLQVELARAKEEDSHKDWTDEMMQILHNMKRLEKSLHKDLGSFASDMGPRALKLPPFPTAALAFRVQPEILMGKAAAANLEAHLSEASKSLERISEDMVAAREDARMVLSLAAEQDIAEAQGLEMSDAESGGIQTENIADTHKQREGRLVSSSIRTRLTSEPNSTSTESPAGEDDPRTPEAIELTSSHESSHTLHPVEKATPPAPMTSPLQGCSEPTRNRSAMEMNLNLSHPGLRKSLEGSEIDELQGDPEPSADTAMDVTAAHSNANDLTASARVHDLLLISPDQEQASLPAEALTREIRMPMTQSPAQTLASRFSKWAPTHDEHVDKLMHQGIEIDFNGDPLCPWRENTHSLPKSVRDILACKPSKSCLSPGAAHRAPASTERTSRRIQFAEKGNVLLLLEPKAEESRGCSVKPWLGLSSWRQYEMSEDVAALDEVEVERHVQENTERNAGSLFSFC